MSSAATFAPPNNLQQYVSVRLEGPASYLNWSSQVEDALSIHDLLGYVDGTEPCPNEFLPITEGRTTRETNPDFTLWNRKNRFVLVWMKSTLAEKVLSMVYGLKTARLAWVALAQRFASPSTSNVNQLKRQMQNLQQGGKNCSEFIEQAKTIADQLAAIGKPVAEEDLISHILGGLNTAYTPFISNCYFAQREKSLSLSDFQSELFAFEALLENHHRSVQPDLNSFAMVANKLGGRGGRNQQKSKNWQHQRSTPAPSFQKPIQGNKSGTVVPPKSGHLPNNSGRIPTWASDPAFDPYSCQLCGKKNHMALDCFHRYDYNYQGRHPPQQLAAMVAQSNSLHDEDTWYVDSGANQHITADIGNLHLVEPYTGDEKVAVGNGNGLQIKHTGKLTLHTSKSTFNMKNVLHCPQAAVNLLSINRFCIDNDCYFILTGSNFYVKDNLTGRTLLTGRSEGGLYPIHADQQSINRIRSSAALMSVRTTLDVWHARLGHPSSKVTKSIVKSFALPVFGSSDLNSVCQPCLMGKSKQLPFEDSSRVVLSVLDLIHSDVWVSPIVSCEGHRYYVIFIDDYSRFTWLYPIRNKSDVFSCFVKFKSLVENRFSSKIKQLQCDNGGEYVSHQFRNFLCQNGIHQRFSCPYTSQQNGLAERKHRHIMETGLSLLAQSHLPTKYWVEAFLTGIYLINRTPTPVLGHISPYFKLFTQAPNYSFLRTFGCACYPLLRPYTKHKLAFRSKQCIFLGYSSQHHGYRCLDPVSQKIYISRNVVFDELNFPAKVWSSSTSSVVAGDSLQGMSFDLTPFYSQLNSQYMPISNTSTESPSLATISSSPGQQPLLPIHDLPQNLIQPPPSPILEPPQSPQIQPLPSSMQPPHSPTAGPSSTNIDLHLTPPPIHPSLPHKMVTRSQTGNLKPKQFPDFKLFYASNHPICMSTRVLNCVEPRNFSQAILSQEWQHAMQVEYDALIANDTWDLVPQPVEQNIIRTKWVYKIKQKADGSIDRYKARLVARGFQQVDGVDFTETFSPVIKPATVRVVLALSMHLDWPILQFDVSNAFLHGTLEKEVFIEQPRGFIDPTYPTHVCRLKKALYGLKQAPRAWFLRLSNSLLDLGFVGSSVDTSLFTFHNGKVHVFVLIYVDDLLITGSSIHFIQTLAAQLKKEFALKALGHLGYFLGIEASRDANGIHLRQSKYILDILHRARMVGAKPYPAPCISGSKLSSVLDEPAHDVTSYRQIVGALQYCTLTRPEIAYSVNQLCQHLYSPTALHWKLTKRVLRYLKGTIDHGLYFTKGSLNLSAYCDSDWAGDPVDRRSTTGYGIFLGPSLVSWCAKKQHVVSRSSTEAEYRALAMVVAELYWIRMLLKDLRMPLLSPPTVWCDNQSAIALAANPVYHARTKHIEVDYHFIREKVINKDIAIQYIPTLDQIADIFTKGLTSSRFQFLRNKLMVCELPIRLRGDVRQSISESEQIPAHNEYNIVEKLL